MFFLCCLDRVTLFWFQLLVQSQSSVYCACFWGTICFVCTVYRIRGQRLRDPTRLVQRHKSSVQEWCIVQRFTGQLLLWLPWWLVIDPFFVPLSLSLSVSVSLSLLLSSVFLCPSSICPDMGYKVDLALKPITTCPTSHTPASSFSSKSL